MKLKVEVLEGLEPNEQIVRIWDESRELAPLCDVTVEDLGPGFKTVTIDNIHRKVVTEISIRTA